MKNTLVHRVASRLGRIGRTSSYRLPKKNRFLAHNEFGLYCVPGESKDRPASQMILNNSVWEPDTIDFIRANCGVGDVVHAGTFFGDFLPGLSAALHAHARLHAFEPVLENYRCARITVELNDLGNVDLMHAGLSGKSGVARIRTRDSNGTPLGGHSKIVPEGNEETPLCTIDEKVGERHVSIIQLDVEGSERPALEGALKTISRCSPLIILEKQDALFASEWFTQCIRARGYKERGMLHDNVVFSP